jgi:hypothetical protein
MDWIFGALAGAGLKMPEAFDLKGIVSIILQVLGLTYANFRARAVAIVGEKLVAGLEQAAAVFKIVMTQGVAGLWEFIKEKVSDLKSMVLDAIFGFVKEKVIVAGVTWIIGLLNPVSAFFKACKAIYDIVMFFVEHGSEILSLVNAVIDSVAAIVKGNITAAAARVEDALAKAIPVAIGFLAGLLGLGDPAKPVKETIEKAQSPVNKAIDWVITKAVALVKAAGKLLGFGKEEDKRPDSDDPGKEAKIAAALAELDQRDTKADSSEGVEHEQAEAIAATVKANHPVLTSIAVVETSERYDYRWTASPAKVKTGVKKKPISLPSWKNIDINMEHIASGHMVGGSRVSTIKDLFPQYMSIGQVEATVRQAYRFCERVATQGERVLVRGSARGLRVEMWVNLSTRTIETAYPVLLWTSSLLMSQLTWKL